MWYNVDAEVKDTERIRFNSLPSQCNMVTPLPLRGLTSRFRLSNDGDATGVSIMKTASCHPERKLIARGLCGPCYRLELAKENNPGWEDMRCLCGCGGIPYPGFQHIYGHYARVMTNEHSVNLGKATASRPMHPNAKAALLRWHLGRPMNDKQREAIRKSNAGRKHSDEERTKRSMSLKGRKLPEHTRQAVSEANRQRVWTDEMRANHWNWKGGVDKKHRPLHWHAISERIRRRDSYECMACHLDNFANGKKKHDVHHIDRNIKNNDDKNLITLCYKCHGSAHRNLEESAKTFRAILAERYGYDYDQTTLYY